MIVSYDSIMKPPYDITNEILRSLTAIAEKLGEVKAAYLQKASPELRKKNRVKTIKASLEIEGNTLSEDQIKAIIEKKRVVGPEKDILEVLNAVEVYNRLRDFKSTELKSFLSAHKLLMKDLIRDPGRMRKRSVGIFKGKEISHVAPPAENLNFLINELFKYLKESDDHILIKSCVAHYEIEFIHPFMDGNGRMGRLWQTLILMNAYPVFEYLPFETIVKEKQKEYYAVLEKSDNEGKSTKFIEFILKAIDEALGALLNNQTGILTFEDRINYFISIYKEVYFTRKDYMNIFRDVSSSTASRDLKFGVAEGLIIKTGEKRMTKYRIVKT